ncbi:MAG: SEC-C domain-containing protein [Lachnospiraceae bacterium]|nr:SEC-C domain-containing protein [Lachnospiraceae bacterium]
MLKPRLIQRGEDPRAYWDIIDNEHDFWSNIIIPDNSDDGEKLAVIKVTGLYRTAEHIGAWSLYDLSDMEEVIDEMLAVEGGEAVTVVKKMFLQEHLKELSMKGFLDEAEVIRSRLDTLIGDGDSEYDSLIRMSNANDKMMSHLLTGEIGKAKKVLLQMADKCNYSELGSVQILAHSCLNIEYISLLSRKYDSIGISIDIVLKCWMLYPEDKTINARRIGCETVICQKKRNKEEIEGSEYEERINSLEKELDLMTFDNTESDESLDFTWSLLKTFKFNFAEEREIRKIIEEADNILCKNMCLSSVASTKIMAFRVLHESFLKNAITHEEVEDLYKLVEANPDSESVRGEFFEMLNYSEDKNQKDNYYNQDIIRESINDARYNPVWGSGIAEIDDIFDPFSDDTQPYVRKHPKIGANEPCPCGSGRKFKKCCRGKGIYD